MGAAIHEAHTLIGRKGADWAAWVEQSLTFNTQMAGNYERAFVYGSLLPPEVLAPYVTSSGSVRQPNLKQISRYLATLKLPHVVGNRGSLPSETHAEIRRLRRGGLSLSEIATLLGVSRTTVVRTCDPAAKERSNRRQREKRQRRLIAERALVKAERDRDRTTRAKQAGGALGESYSHLRHALTTLAKASGEAKTSAGRGYINEAIAMLYKGEDAIGEALREQLS